MRNGIQTSCPAACSIKFCRLFFFAELHTFFFPRVRECVLFIGTQFSNLYTAVTMCVCFSGGKKLLKNQCPCVRTLESPLDPCHTKIEKLRFFWNLGKNPGKPRSFLTDEIFSFSRFQNSNGQIVVLKPRISVSDVWWEGNTGIWGFLPEKSEAKIRSENLKKNLYLPRTVWP